MGLLTIPYLQCWYDKCLELYFSYQDSGVFAFIQCGIMGMTKANQKNSFCFIHILHTCEK